MDPVEACDPKWTSECLFQHQQMGCRASWDINNSLQTPESCLPPVTRNCLKLFCQNTCSFSVFTHRVLFFSQQIQKRLDSLLCAFESKHERVHFRGGRWQCATSYIKSGYSVRGGFYVLFCASWRRDESVFCCSFQSLRREGDCNLLAPQLLKWMDGMFGSIKFLLCREKGKGSNLAAVCIPHRWLYRSAGKMWWGGFHQRWQRAREFIRDLRKREREKRAVCCCYCPWGSGMKKKRNCSGSIGY